MMFNGLAPVAFAEDTGFQEDIYRAMQALDQKRDADIKKTLHQYEGILEKLEAYFKQQSDLEGILAIRAETKRLKDSQDLTEADRAAKPEKLAGLQNQVITRIQHIRKAHAESVISSSAAWWIKGKKLQEELVRHNRIEDAVAVKETLEQHTRSPAYKQAANFLEEFAEPASSSGTNATNTPAERAPETHSSSATTVNTGAGEAVIYRKGAKPPRFSGKKENLIFTGKESRAASGRLQALLTLGEKKKLSPPNPPKESTYYQVSGDAVVPYLTLTAGPQAIRGCTLYLEYYVKQGGSRVKARTETIPLGDIAAAESLTVVADGFMPAYIRTHVHTDGSSHSVYSSDGPPRGEDGGLIISMYDRDGQMVYQRCSENGLIAMATVSPP